MPDAALLDVPLTWRELCPGGPAPPPSLRPAVAASLVPLEARARRGAALLEDVLICDAGSARGGAGAPAFAACVLRRDASAAQPPDAAAGGPPGAEQLRWLVPAVQGAPPRPREHPAACAVGATASLLFFGGWDGTAELADAFLLRRLPPDDADAAPALAAARRRQRRGGSGAEHAPHAAAPAAAVSALPLGAPAEAPPPRLAWAGPLPATGGAPAPRSHATLTAAAGQVFLFGGYRADVGALNELWAARPSGCLDGDDAEQPLLLPPARSSGGADPWEDPVALTWHRPDAAGAPPAPRSGHAACAAADGCIYVHGGFDGGRELSDLHRFDPAAATWEELRPWGPAPGPRRLHAIAAAGRHIVLFGGWDGCGAACARGSRAERMCGAE
jgi:hypothetical protein